MMRKTLRDKTMSSNSICRVSISNGIRISPIIRSITKMVPMGAKQSRMTVIMKVMKTTRERILSLDSNLRSKA